MAKKVIVSGCFDLLHSGHIAFFREAASYGDLYVALGSDKTIFDLKGRVPINTEKERLYMVRSVKCVKDAFISQSSPYLSASSVVVYLGNPGCKAFNLLSPSSFQYSVVI